MAEAGTLARLRTHRIELIDHALEIVVELAHIQLVHDHLVDLGNVESGVGPRERLRIVLDGERGERVEARGPPKRVREPERHLPIPAQELESVEIRAQLTEMARRIEEAASATLPWLVAEREGRIVGYANARKWRPRSAYRFSAEVTVYVAPDCMRLGIGSRLYEELFPSLRARGIHAVMGGIALPNEASVALHEKLGFSKVAHFKEVGFKFNKWIDVGYWQRGL